VQWRHKAKIDVTSEQFLDDKKLKENVLKLFNRAEPKIKEISKSLERIFRS